MKFVALVSGGKDSIFSAMEATAEGHTLVALANLYPRDVAQQEVDSHCFQTVGHHLVTVRRVERRRLSRAHHHRPQAIAECIGVPIFRRALLGSSVAQQLVYTATAGDEACARKGLERQPSAERTRRSRTFSSCLRTSRRRCQRWAGGSRKLALAQPCTRWARWAP
jgi:diphthamide synthase (EF-2-diphthine--ammonia ligase)